MAKVKHAGGPYLGPDIELAREVAREAVKYYGNDSALDHQRIMRGQIWNDHIAVQAAFTAIKHIRNHGLPELSDEEKRRAEADRTGQSGC